MGSPDVVCAIQQMHNALVQELSRTNAILAAIARALAVDEAAQPQSIPVGRAAYLAEKEARRQRADTEHTANRTAPRPAGDTDLGL